MISRVVGSDLPLMGSLAHPCAPCSNKWQRYQREFLLCQHCCCFRLHQSVQDGMPSRLAYCPCMPSLQSQLCIASCDRQRKPCIKPRLSETYSSETFGPADRTKPPAARVSEAMHYASPKPPLKLSINHESLKPRNLRPSEWKLSPIAS